jgi:hypothetical protein
MREPQRFNLGAVHAIPCAPLFGERICSACAALNHQRFAIVWIDIPTQRFINGISI